MPLVAVRHGFGYGPDIVTQAKPPRVVDGPMCCLKTCNSTMCPDPAPEAGVVSGVTDPTTYGKCDGPTCFAYDVDWTSGSTATTLSAHPQPPHHAAPLLFHRRLYRCIASLASSFDVVTDRTHRTHALTHTNTLALTLTLTLTDAH